MMHISTLKRKQSLLFALLLSLSALFVLLRLMTVPGAAQAGPGIRYVAPTGDDGGDCSLDAPCRTLQHAVDVSAEHDEIRVAAGVYTGTHTRPAPDGYNGPSVITQVVYISKTLDVRGGYSADFATWDPSAYTTTLDAEGLGRVIMIAGEATLTLEGLHVTGGDAAGLEGGRNENHAGGGIYVLTATMTISGCRVIGNVAVYGAGIYVGHSNNTVLNGNVVRENTGSITSPFQEAGSGIILENSHNATLNNNAVLSNSVVGIGLVNNRHTIVSGNSVLYNPFGIIVVLDVNDILNDNIIANTPLSTGQKILLGYGIQIQDNSGTLLRGNTIQDTGGGIYLTGSSNVVVENNTIHNNEDAYRGGGGIYLADNDTVTLRGNTIFSNTASVNGGGILAENNTVVTLSDNAISSNTAQSSGGGIYMTSNTTLTLSSNTILSNTANGEYNPEADVYGGGGLSLVYYDYALLENNLFQANVAQREEQYSIGGGALLGGITAILSNNSFQDNIVGDRTTIEYSMGGGLSILASNVTLTHNVFRNNAAYRGSAIHVEALSQLTMTHNRILSNTAWANGGSLYIQNSPDARLDNNVVADNQGPVGGVYAHDSAVHMRHTTLARNSGVGIYAGDPEWHSGKSYVVMTNTILVGHTTGISTTENNTAILNGVLWYDNATNVTGTGTLTVTGQVTGSPAFAGDGYHITAASAALDTGLDGDLLVDIDGDPRPMGLHPDLGADEFRLVELVPDRNATASPGDIIVYTHTLTNHSDLSLPLVLSATSSQAWDVAIHTSATQTAMLPYTLTLAPGGSSAVTLSVQVPADAPHGAVDATTLTATSSALPNLWATVTDTTTLAWTVYLPLVMR